MYMCQVLDIHCLLNVMVIIIIIFMYYLFCGGTVYGWHTYMYIAMLQPFVVTMVTAFDLSCIILQSNYTYKILV